MYIDAPGSIIPRNTLRIQKAIELVIAIEKLPFFILFECRRLENEDEVIVFDTEPQIGQVCIHDIKNIERIAVIFDKNDEQKPEVLALRESFPLVPHLNLRSDEKPRSLCLYEQSYDELKLRWTASSFLNQLRLWLTLTSKGELHGTDQPLEPLLPESSSFLIFPFEFILGKSNDNNKFMIIKHNNSEWIIDDKINSFFHVEISGSPQESGIISKQPANIIELNEFLKNAGIDLLCALRSQIKMIHEQLPDKNKNDLHSTPLLIIAHLPKKRTDASNPETADVWAFLVNTPISQIGVEIGIWDIRDKHIAGLMEIDQNKIGDNLPIEILNPMPSFTKGIAAIASGHELKIESNIMLIGAGALGSQIMINLVRMGIGNITIVDNDCLFPHNLARHALPGFFIGHSKAIKLAEFANNIIQGNPIATPISTDVLHPKNHQDKLETAYNSSNIIIDLSASIPVSRHLARDLSNTTRRVSIFLNPSGSDLVALVEDIERNVTLDCLEMQYYRYLISETSLKDHLIFNEGSVRYARSCRDISSKIPQDLVALHASIGSRVICNLLSKDNGNFISIWQFNPENQTVANYRITAYNTFQLNFEEWTIIIDQYIIDKLRTTRLSKLPNETGGILIGSYDLSRKIIYIVDSILSPPDSKENPYSYQRGVEGLNEQLKSIRLITSDNLEYIGEWHSHPTDDVWPSKADDKLFSWILDIMSAVGLPSLMLIIGENHEFLQIKKL